MTIRHVLGGIVAFHVQLVADGCEACIILTGGECATIPLKRSSDISSYLSSLVEESNGCRRDVVDELVLIVFCQVELLKCRLCALPHFIWLGFTSLLQYVPHSCRPRPS